MATRLVIVDDHAMVRSGVEAGLPSDIQVVGQAADRRLGSGRHHGDPTRRGCSSTSICLVATPPRCCQMRRSDDPRRASSRCRYPTPRWT